jgi:signal transduction histidine kinase/CheY-like chemotaxis protein
MKRFFIIFLAVCILFSAFLYLPIWCFLAGIFACITYIAYQFYLARLRSMEARTEGLEQQVEQLHKQLDQSIYKEQKASKEAEQVKQAKQDLLAVMSHEIRTPMNGVLGMLGLLTETKLTREQSEYADSIRSCGESLLTTVTDILVNDMLNFSKLDQDEKQLENKDYDLRNSVEEVLEMFAVRTAQAGVELLYAIDEDVPEHLTGDPIRLRQVLMNLVENAVKFTSRGEIFVGIHLAAIRTGIPSEIGFEIRDTGIGIAEDKLGQLFTGMPGAVSQAEEESAQAGLGLVVCKRLTELMGGRIEATSQLGQGSVFTFTIPLNPSSRSRHNHVIKVQMAALEGKHVMVVDDNPTHRAILLKQLESWKMVPVGADCSDQALKILSGNIGFDLVMTDLTMPETNGIQLARSLKDRYPSLRVILMNQAGDERYKQDSDLFYSVLTKPLRQYMLRDHILGLCSQPLTASSAEELAATKISGDFAKQYPLHILIAEDNLINQKIAMKILTKFGYQPALARNGKEVLEMVSYEHYDLILMDVQMPEMDGFEATRMLRLCLEIQPVIIAMTANVLQGDRDDCMQSGMDDYISKPIEMQELLTQLMKWGQVIKDKRKIPL